MAEWTYLSDLSDLEQDQLHGFDLDGFEVVAKSNGSDVVCFIDRCSHQPLKLSEFGCILNGELLCNAHGARFCASTGERASGPATTDLQRVPVKVVNNKIYVSQEFGDPADG